MTETPDYWVIVDLNGVKKILCSWAGGYLGSDQWRLSSGIVHAMEFPDRYDIVNTSGSLYVCFKDRQKCSSYMLQKINNWRNAHGDHLKLTVITLPSPEIKIIDSKGFGIVYS